MKEILDLNISNENNIISEGANEGIIDVLITDDDVKAIFINVLKIETLNIDRIIIINQFFLNNS